MNYQIIVDRPQIEAFIDWLPELKQNELYSGGLFARSKYCKDITHIRSDKMQMDRFVCKKEYILRSIMKMETKVGTYFDRNVSIPQEALAMYINPNPRSVKLAMLEMQVMFAKMALHPDKDREIDLNYLTTSEQQKARSRKIFRDIDFDNVTVDEIKPKIEAILNPEAYRILVTRGGLHVLLELGKIDVTDKKWYRKIIDLVGSDLQRDAMIPIPGTYQGGFTPYFL